MMNWVCIMGVSGCVGSTFLFIIMSARITLILRCIIVNDVSGVEDEFQNLELHSFGALFPTPKIKNILIRNLFPTYPVLHEKKKKNNLLQFALKKWL